MLTRIALFIYKTDIDNCKNESPIYLFWIKDNKYYKRKFSDCKIYPATEVEISNFLTTIKENIGIIKDAEIRPVIHKLPKKSDGTQEEIQSVVSHSCTSTFIISTKDQVIKKQIDNYELQTEMIDKETPNDNYEFNQNSILNTLIQRVNKEIKYFITLSLNDLLLSIK